MPEKIANSFPDAGLRRFKEFLNYAGNIFSIFKNHMEKHESKIHKVMIFPKFLIKVSEIKRLPCYSQILKKMFLIVLQGKSPKLGSPNMVNVCVQIQYSYYINKVELVEF